MTMTIIIKCKSCGNPFQAKETLAGKRVKCPHCHQKLTVPDPRKAFASHVVSDQMSRNTDEGRGSALTSVVSQVRRDLDQIGSQIDKIQEELAEVRRMLNES